MSELGIVVIGRNEGERLRRCLASVTGRGYPVVYVDSGSTDGSVELAWAMGADVVNLDMSRPFTMARGRNEGFARLEQIDPRVQYVQFLDGDCELVEGWLARGLVEIEAHARAASVCGRRRERYPDQTVYNRMADLDWDMPVGELTNCTGDTMTRASAFREAGGFNPLLISAEDSELCLRFRRAGWKVLQVDCEMSVHDMAMTQFGQWWKRCVRTGFAFAEGVRMHGSTPERHFVKQLKGVMIWGVAVPLIIFGLLWPTRGASLALLSGYVYLYWRIRQYGSRRGWLPEHAALYARFCVLAKFPEAVGAVTYWFRRLARRETRLIEYKGPGATRPRGELRPRQS